MRSTRPLVLDDDPASLDAIWSALEPEPGTPTPMIRAVMISSVDGTATVDGRSGGLGTPTDKLVYDAMRTRADLVVVGSTTALIEGYGPAGVSPVWADRRPGPPPVVVVLTGSLPDRLIDHCAGTGGRLQIAAANGVDGDRIEAARSRGVTVHVLDAGPTGAAIRSLATRLRADEVALEGGPTLLGAVLAEGAVDELVLSVAPEVVIGGDPTSLVSGDGGSRIPMRVVSAFTCARGGLYTRWVTGGDTR